MKLPAPIRFGLLLIAGAAATSADAVTTLQSTETQTALVELYTSEGCSSCPPADAWLGRLTARPGLWRDFVPVAFHVHYWDRLGWRDKLADPGHADRQQTYARAWGSASVYTPALVLNGAEWRSWSAATEPRPNSRPAVGVLRATSADERTWKIEFQSTRLASGRFDLFAATLECGIVSPVKAGENAGRRLTHDFVVRQLRQVALTAKDKIHTTELALPPSTVTPAGRRAVAFWVTVKGKLEPVQATGGWLNVAPGGTGNVNKL